MPPPQQLPRPQYERNKQTATVLQCAKWHPSTWRRRASHSLESAALRFVVSRTKVHPARAVRLALPRAFALRVWHARCIIIGYR